MTETDTPEPTELTPAQAKKALRAKIRAQRALVDGAERADRAAAHARLIGEYLDAMGHSDPAAARAVGLYASAPDEPDTLTVMTRLHDQGVEVYLPVCEPEHQLSWVKWYPGVEVARSRYAPIDEPVGPRHGVELFEEIRLLCIPALAIDAHGIRLGQGGGYYDRFLPKLPSHTTVAAMIYSEEFLSDELILRNEYDMSVDLVFTPDGVQKPAAG